MEKSSSPSNDASHFRLPCAVVVVQLCWLFTYPLFDPGSTFQYPFLVYSAVPTFSSLILLKWFLSRASDHGIDRRHVKAVFAAIIFSQSFLLDRSLNWTRLIVFQPVMSNVLVGTMFVFRNQPPPTQWRRTLGVLIVMIGFTCVLAIEGMNGVLVPQFTWRWQRTADRQPIEIRPSVDRGLRVDLPAKIADSDWTSFRGPNRDSVVANVRIETDWDKHPPAERWRMPIGPGWSSFCVVGDYAFTQEQRGPNEVISCRLVSSGEIMWIHEVEGRFEDSSSGTGPRSTPTYFEGRLFALTANGKLLCLEAVSGQPVWQDDLTTRFKVDVPHWGFASSPLIFGDLVIVFTGADEGKSVAAFDTGTGTLRWSGGNGNHSYSSPHLVVIEQQPQILMTSNQGIESLDPEQGTRIWNHEWQIGFSARIAQPCQIDDSSLLLPTGYGKGTRRLNIEKEGERWSVQPSWTSRQFKPYFSDFVYLDRFVYGFDGNILTCIDVASGERRWRQRGFGNGQLVLLSSQRLLMIISERGAVSLVKADEDGYHLLAEFQAIEGKTWNHPVLSGSHLLVRNASEAACFRLKLAESAE